MPCFESQRVAIWRIRARGPVCERTVMISDSATARCCSTRHPGQAAWLDECRTVPQADA
jgi:hypothetical protein